MKLLGTAAVISLSFLLSSAIVKIVDHGDFQYSMKNSGQWSLLITFYK